MFTPELLSKFSKVFIRRELGSNFELYPNMKMLFVVRDPRSMISARLRFVQSLAARKNQFYAQLQYWYQLNKDLISLCDQYPGKCIIVRYEDLVIRKRLEVLKVITYKQPLTLRIRNFWISNLPRLSTPGVTGVRYNHSHSIKYTYCISIRFILSVFGKNKKIPSITWSHRSFSQFFSSNFLSIKNVFLIA